MADIDDRSRKALLLVLVIVIAGASFYLGFHLAKTESEQGNAGPAAPTETSYSSLQLLTSPEGEAEDAIINMMRGANHSIYVEMYIFTNTKLASALIEAKKRGVTVRVLLDTTEGEDIGNIVTLLTANNIEVRKAPGRFRIMHAKVMIVDGAIVLVGSHNWSQSAMFYNREISVILQSPSLASQMLKIFDSDWEESAPV